MKLEVVESKIAFGNNPAQDWYIVQESTGKGKDLYMKITHLDEGTQIDVMGQEMFNVLFSKMPENKGT